MYGNLISLLTVMKGLPLTYNKDLQEDKEPIFDTVDTVLMSLRVLEMLVDTTEFRTDRMAEGLNGDFSDATDLADFLVRQGVPFRSAHEISGKLVQYCIENGKTFADLTLDELSLFSDKFTEVGVTKGAIHSIEARDIPGSTAPGQIRKQIQAARDAVSAD